MRCCLIKCRANNILIEGRLQKALQQSELANTELGEKEGQAINSLRYWGREWINKDLIEKVVYG